MSFWTHHESVTKTNCNLVSWANPEKKKKLWGQTFVKKLLEFFGFLLYRWKLTLETPQKSLGNCKAWNQTPENFNFFLIPHGNSMSFLIKPMKISLGWYSFINTSRNSISWHQLPWFFSGLPLAYYHSSHHGYGLNRNNFLSIILQSKKKKLKQLYISEQFRSLSCLLIKISRKLSA